MMNYYYDYAFNEGSFFTFVLALSEQYPETNLAHSTKKNKKTSEVEKKKYLLHKQVLDVARYFTSQR